MNSRQRVLDALGHKQPDRVPVDFGASAVTGMHVTCVAALREYYGLEKRPVKVHEPFQMLGLIEEDLKQAMGVDVEPVNGRKTLFGFENRDWKEWRLDSGLLVLIPRDFNITEDQAGNKYIYPEGDMSVPPSGKMPKNGYYFDALIRQEALGDEDPDPADNLEEFGEFTEEDISYYSDECRRAADSGRAVFINFGGTGLGDIALVPAPFMKHPRGIRDIQEWYMSTVLRQDFMHAVFEKQTDIAIRNMEKLNNATGGIIDIVFICGTDFGTQTGTFCSENTFRELYMPYYRKMNSWIKANTSWKTFKHSCGAVADFIPLFIESGFDIINPVQCSAKGMGPEMLKAKYGAEIVFWGGGADTQSTLPFGTPEEVRAQVAERCRIFSPGGGFVFNAVHNVQARTPVENIAAMLEAVKAFV